MAAYNIIPKLQIQTDLDLTTATVTGYTPSLPSLQFKTATGNFPTAGDIIFAAFADTPYFTSASTTEINIVSSGKYQLDFAFSPTWSILNDSFAFAFVADGFTQYTYTYKVLATVKNSFSGSIVFETSGPNTIFKITSTRTGTGNANIGSIFDTSLNLTKIS